VKIDVVAIDDHVTDMGANAKLAPAVAGDSVHGPRASTSGARRPSA